MSGNDGTIITRERGYAQGRGRGYAQGRGHGMDSNSHMVTQITTLDDNGNMMNMLETTTKIRNGKKVVKSMAMDYTKKTITRQVMQTRLHPKKISESSGRGRKLIATGAARKSKAARKSQPEPVVDPWVESDESGELEEVYEQDESSEIDDSDEPNKSDEWMTPTPWLSMMKTSFDNFSALMHEDDQW